MLTVFPFQFSSHVAQSASKEIRFNLRYQFTCSCQACISNFPLFEQLSEFDEYFDDFISSDLESIENFQENEAKSAIKRYSKYIEKHIEKYPCYEISLLQECVLRCFRVLEKFETEVNRKLIEML